MVQTQSIYWFDKIGIDQKLYTVYLESMCRNDLINLFMADESFNSLSDIDVFIDFRL